MLETRSVYKPSYETIKFIESEYERLKGKGKSCHRHMILLKIFSDMIKLNWEIPIKFDNMFSIFDLDYLADKYGFVQEFKKFLTDNNLGNFKEEVDDDFKSKWFTKIADIWFSARALEISDTPNWYILNDNFVYSLLATSIKNVYSDDIHLPFPAFYIEFPKGLLSIVNNDVKCSIDCIGVSKVIWESDMHLQGVNYVSKEQLILCLVLNANEKLAKQGGATYFHVAFDKGHTITDCISMSPYLFENFKFLDFTDEKAFSMLVNVVIGFLLFLKEKNNDVVAKKTNKKKGKLKKVIGHTLINANTWLVGSKIKLDPAIKESVRSGKSSISYTHKVVVPGHFQRYRHGSRDDWHYVLHKKEPYVKNGDGLILGHSYKK